MMKKFLFSMMVCGACSVIAGELATESWNVANDWKVEDQSLVSGKPGFLYLKDRKNYTKAEFSAEVTPIKATGASWKVAGIGFLQAGDQFWYLGLVESPDNNNKSHFFELKMMQGKTWGAESKLKNLKRKSVGSWNYGETYKFTIKLADNKIAGTIANKDGKVIAEFEYELSADSVNGGTPVLRNALMETKYGKFSLAE